jgi:hypothetical protein
MSNTLMQLVNNLNIKERKEVKELLSTQLLGGEEKHIKGFNYLMANENTAIDKQKIFEICFGDKPFIDVQLRLLFSELTKMLKKYIAIKKAVEDESYIANATLTKAKEKGNEKLFSRLLNKDRKRVNQENIKSDAYFDQVNFLFLEEYGFKSAKSRSQDFHLQDMVNALENKHAIEMMRMCCLSIDHGIVSGLKYDLSYFNHNITHFYKAKFEQNTTLKLFLYCYQILTLPFDNDTFEQLLSTLSADMDSIEDKDAKTIYNIIINFCIRQFNFGNTSYGEKTIQLYTSGIENKFLLNRGFISRYTYRNIITLAIKTNNIGLAREVCNEYQYLLNAKERQASYDFAMAQIEYVERDYHSAQVRLSSVNFDDHLLNLAAKTMLIKIFYLNKEFDLLSFHIDAMRMYIMRKKVIGYHKENYLNIITTMKKFLKIYAMSKDQIRQLHNTISNTSPLTEKQWFLERLDWHLMH